MSTPPPGPLGLPARVKEGMAKLRRPPEAAEPVTEPAFDPTSWGGALIVMCVFGAVLTAIQIVNASQHQDLDRFGLKPRQVDGLWGILTQPFLHDSYGHLFANLLTVVLIGWVLLLAGVRAWLFVTTVVVLLGGALTWLVGPSGPVIVGASGMVFGWMGYLLARAYFSRRLKWILEAVALLVIFGTLLGSLVPAAHSTGAWQSHLCGFLAGGFVGWLLHPRHGRSARTSRSPRAVS
ncbi:rhomboid family intramembrane serine protease [Jatrophihabitans sp.]|uniref:rhomboid family intramembrane serine protease n=1 Tax=Jatrophihabitans sp. TaxID=1932789 RepID=UPI0030C722D9